MIVVAGGSGLLGRLVVTDLLSRGEQVRVLVRDVDRARALFGSAVEIVAGDVRRADGFDRLVDGAAVVISAVHGFLGGRGAGPVEVDQHGNANLVAAAGGTGATVVLVSVLGAAHDSPVAFFRAKYEAEQQLRGSGTPWTIVRSAAFVQTWLAVLSQTAGRSGRPMVFGRGEQPIAFVSAEDVATVVSRAATDPTLLGQVLEVAGEHYSMNQLASALQDTRGWHGSPRHLPRSVLRILSALAGPINPAFARQSNTALAMDTTVLAGNTRAASPTGRPLQTLSDVLRSKPTAG